MAKLLSVKKLRKRLLQWANKEDGSFTLESTIVFPILLSLILIFIVFSMYMYQKVVLYYSASITAERAAFSWDNSYRNPRNGMLSETNYDGLYWRIGEDKMLEGLFGLNSNAPEATVQLPFVQSSEESNASELSYRKIEKAADWIGQAGLSYEGQISYSRTVLKRMIEAKLEQPLSLQPIDNSWLNKEPRTVTSALIVDPTEFIRSVDLARYYTNKLTNGGGGSGQTKEQAGKVLAPYKSNVRKDNSPKTKR